MGTSLGDSSKDGRTALLDHAARSVKWSLLYNIVPRLVTPFSTMVLAMLLTPDDFGLVAIATFVIALARIVVDFGVGRTVIQRQTEIDEAASMGLWVSLVVSATLLTGLWVVAPWLAVAYNHPQVTDVIRVASLALPLMALVAMPKALLHRRMDFRSLFWVNSSFLIVQAIAAVGLAIVGIGYWALILGQLTGMAISAGLAWRLVRWRPQRVLHWRLLRSMLGFSAWVMLSGFQDWLFLYGANAIAGALLGIRGLGIYSLGFSIAIVIPTFLGAAAADVAYPTFCKLQGGPQEVGRSLARLQTLMSAVLFPIAAGIAAVSPSAVELLYGQKWDGLGAVVAILVIMPGLSCIWAISESAYQAVGRPDLWPKLAGFSLLALLPLLWVAAPHGLMTFTLARFGGAWILPIGSLLFQTRVLGISVAEGLRGFAGPLFYSTIMYLAVAFSLEQLSPYVGVSGWIKLLLVITVGVAIYLLLTRVGNRRLWNQLQVGARQVLS